MKRMDFDLFRLEDRVLFEAAAVAEIVEAAEAVQENPNANVNEAEKQAQEERKAGQQVLVSRMNKNKKFQKEQLAKEGYEEIVEFFNR